MTPIPDSHADLLREPLPAVLVTLMPDGRPQGSVVWVDYTDGTLTLNSQRGRRKTKNMERDPRATVVVVDPTNQHRYMELRCEVRSISEVGALEHRDRLDAAYLGPDHHSDPADDEAPRVIVTLEPVGVHAYG
jgi:PPOX class probable F420-dependent enzyme